MQLALRRWGSGPRAALLVHGLASSAEGWWRLGPALAEQGFTVTAPDLRGHGASEPADRFDMDAYAADLTELGDTWDVVVGHSLGGAIAVVAQSKNPGWCRRLVLLDPALWMDPEPETEAQLTEPFRRPLSKEAVMEAHPTWHPRDAEVKAEALRATALAVVVETFRQNRPWNVIGELARVDSPVLLVGSDPRYGSLVPQALGEGLAAISSALTYRWVPHSTHSLHRDEYDATWSIVAEWLGP